MAAQAGQEVTAEASTEAQDEEAPAEIPPAQGPLLRHGLQVAALSQRLLHERPGRSEAGPATAPQAWSQNQRGWPLRTVHAGRRDHIPAQAQAVSRWPCRRFHVGEAQPVRITALFIAGILTGCVAVVWVPFAAITLTAALGL